MSASTDSIPPDALAAERPRRTQSERRSATRQRLLAATIESLIELGYSATTTLEVERRAGASRGARIHHFPTKAELLAAAVDELFNQLSAHYDIAFGGAAGGHAATDAQRLCTGLRHLWSIYSGPEYLASLELHMAARTDEELRRQLFEVTQRHRALALQAARTHFPSVPADIAIGLVHAVQTTLLGLLTQRSVDTDPQREHLVLSLLEALVVSYLPRSAP
jgi:AcrR family transcriptional regulator